MRRRSADKARERWGTRELADETTREIVPSLAGDGAVWRWFSDYHRFAASPGAAAEFFRMLGDTDLSDVLPTIRVPTLVVHRGRWRDAALRVSELIPGARAVQVPGGDSPVWVDDEVAAEVERFLGIEFVELGTRALKGVPGEWRLYAVPARDA
jgi:pimeloyl-ACP methyl ester carboxylesterase